MKKKNQLPELISLIVKLIICMAIIGWLESCTQAMTPTKAATKGGLKCGKGYIR